MGRGMMQLLLLLLLLVVVVVVGVVVIIVVCVGIAAAAAAAASHEGESLGETLENGFDVHVIVLLLFGFGLGSPHLRTRKCSHFIFEQDQ